jgi:hypothetical protein
MPSVVDPIHPVDMMAGESVSALDACLIPVSINADWYARGVGGAAAFENNKIPASRHRRWVDLSAGWYKAAPK